MFSSILSNFGARLFVAFLNFAALLLTTHYLGSNVRGEISLVQLAVSLVHLISDIAGGPGMIYLVPRAKRSTLLLCGYAWSAVCAWGFGWLVVHYGNIPPSYQLAVTGLAFIVSALSVNMNYLVGKEEIRSYNLILLINAVLMFSVMALVIYFNREKNPDSYIIGAYSGNILAFVLSLFLVFRQKDVRQEAQHNTIFLLFRNGFFNQFASLTHQLSLRVNYYFLSGTAAVAVLLSSSLKDKAAVGLYSTALALAEAILLLSLSTATVLQSRVANTDDKTETRRLTFLLAKFSLAVTIPALIFFMLLPDVFYSRLLGKDFQPVREVFWWLVPGAVMVSFGSVFSHYFAGCGKHYFNAISGISALIVTLVSASVLIPEYGLKGAALSASCAYATITIVIFSLFLFEKGRSSGDWKHLLPSSEDFRMMKRQIKKKNA